MNIRRITAALATAGLAIGLIGAGVAAQYTDTGTATVSAAVGTFKCVLSSTDPHAVVSPDGHTVTITASDLQSSAQVIVDSNLTLKNTGSIPLIAHWTITGPVYGSGPGSGHIGVSSGAPNMANDLPLAPGASQLYTGIGFQMADPTQPGQPDHGYPLTNADLGLTFTATYKVDCHEVPPPASSHISFVGFAEATGHAALTLPAGAQPGDLAVVMTYGTSSVNPGCPSGYTVRTNTVQDRTYLCSRVLIAGDTAVPATSVGNGKSVAVYRGASGLGAATYQNTSNGLPPESPNYPLYCSALSLTRTDSSSWVGCMTHDTGNTTGDIRQVVFSRVIT